ncbi:ABC transporter substrate-binding protein/permease [Lactobacillus sp. DCY120]|uniref:ABC transporter substrate-binding protein/permease n=1 Tax=Bombilactobacillus apium TaxID=2675299 RepID=A0A850QZF5_9LACO|nr:ABC transporter substrate-binding protein/permease [Bombilactobacillus apium]NVY96073.1 ABC transporter substrate-binding protein/permease [Bombilactobacillus apium]
MKKLGKLITSFLAFTLLFGLFMTPSLSHADDQPQANDNYLQKVKDRGKIVMGTSPDFPPYEFTTKINGKSEIVGMDVEISKKIAHDLGVKLVIKPMDFDSLLVALQTGKVDMVLAGMNKTAKREKSVDFSNKYFNGGWNLIIRQEDRDQIKDYHNLETKAVGVQTGTIQYDLMKKKLPKAKMKGMDKNPDLILALKTHKIDAIAMGRPSAEAYANNTAGIVTIKSGITEKISGNSAAFPKGSTSLVNFVNEEIKDIQKKDLIKKQYLPKAGKYMAATSDKSSKKSGKKSPQSSNSMWAYKDYFIAGIGYTLLISAIAVILGFALGVILAFMRLSKNSILHSIATCYIEFIRGTPLMVQLLFIYFGLGTVVNIPALVSGIIAVGLNSAAYVAEVIRSGISSIATGQTEAARSLGLSKKQTMQYIIFPQAMKNIWPALGNEFVSLIKESSIVSIIGVKDLIYQSRIVQADTYRGVAPLVVTMVLYFIVTFGLSRLMKLWEGKMNHDGK